MAVEETRFRLADLPTGPAVFERLPEIDRDDVRYLWDVNYWDGPLAGMLLYAGRKYWFENPEQHWPTGGHGDSEDFASTRRFLVIELSPEQMAEQEHWHALFQEQVGHTADYDEYARTRAGPESLQASSRARQFYDEYCRADKMDLSNNFVVGWFEMRRGDGAPR